MASNLKAHLTHYLLLLICYFAAVAAAYAAHPARNTSPQHLSYNPRDFTNDRLYRAYLVIQRFKGTIISDPKNITATWTGSDICGDKTYLGFYCDKPLEQAKDLTVTAVLFNGFGLTAPKLRGFIDELPDLALFHAASNNFGDGIPLLDNLSYLYGFNVVNEMKAYVPPNPRNVVEGGTGFSAGGEKPCITTFLNFTFHIRAGFGSAGKSGGLLPGATNAKVLLLNYNHLSGRLPTKLGFSKLSYLALANNKLTGPIPSSIGHLQDSLFEVLLLNNQLSGCLPHELGMLHKATVIDAGKNQLTGPISSSFTCLASVEQLNLGENRLYGQVPDALCKLAAGPSGRLANLTLSGNYFTSVGPACAALIKDGVLDVKNNCIPGLANQRKPAECAAFQSQPKTTCPAASAQVACPAGAATAAAAPGERGTREYSSYVTYATLHE